MLLLLDSLLQETKFKFQTPGGQAQAMAGAHKFRIGDPVWAKMKGFSPWPGKVCLPPTDCKRPAVKKQMHCVMFFGTNDYAWIEEVNMKDYAQYKSTFVKPKQSKAIANAIEEIEKYCKGRGESTTPIGGGGDGVSEEDDEEEFDQLISGTPTSTKVLINITPLITSKLFLHMHL